MIRARDSIFAYLQLQAPFFLLRFLFPRFTNCWSYFLTRLLFKLKRIISRFFCSKLVLFDGSSLADGKLPSFTQCEAMRGNLREQDVSMPPRDRTSQKASVARQDVSMPTRDRTSQKALVARQDVSMPPRDRTSQKASALAMPAGLQLY